MLLLGCCPLGAQAAEKVRLQLKWKHQFQFAGYYAAMAQGFYKDAGLEVTIVPADPAVDPVQEVVQGKADFGIGATDLLLMRSRQVPVVALAAIFQHSPLAFMTLRKTGLQTVHELAGSKLMLEGDHAELLAYLRSEGINTEKLTLLPHSFDVRDLLTAKVDGMSVYVTDEPFLVRQAGQDYLLYSPRAEGIDFYSDILFTTEKTISARPEVVKRFREASLRGWDYAMHHQEELVQLISTQYHSEHSVEHLRFEAQQMEPLLQTTMVEIGHMNPGRWRHIAEVYANMGMLPPDFALKSLLYDPTPRPPNLRWIYGTLAAIVLLLLIATLVAVRFARLSAALTRITAVQAQTQAALRAGEDKFRLLTERSKDVVWTLDTTTMRFLYISPSVQKLRGYAPAEIIGATLDAALIPGTAEAIKDRIRQRAADARAGTLSPEQYFTAEVEQPCKDGSRVWTEVITHYYLNEQTGLIELHGVTRDISARKRAEQALQFNQFAIEQMADGAYWINATGRIEYVNAATCRMLGYTKEEMLSKVVADIDFDFSAERWAPHWQELKAAGSLAFESRHRTKTGTIIPVEIHANYVVFDGKELNCGFVRNISKRRQAAAEKERLETQNRQLQKTESLGRMAGAIAHHFNNHLQVVMGNVELAAEDLPRNAAARDLLLAAMDGARKAVQVSGLMLTYLGHTFAQREELDLAAACAQSRPLLAVALPKDVRLETDLPQPGPLVHADASQLQQVLNHLVVNAWEAMIEHPGVIRLRVSTVAASALPTANRFPLDWQPRAATYACLEVADAGSGIVPADVERIFDPYFSRKFTGRGMGLAVVLGIVRAHHGAVSVASELGRGSTFSVYLPVASATEAAQPGASLPQLPAVAERAPARVPGTVLVVEDEPAVRQASAHMLARAGYTVLEAPDGVAALALFRQHQAAIVCVLCDLTMPGMDGWETLAALRHLAPTLPVILASGYSEAQVMAGEHAELPQAFLSKPYTSAVLQATLARVLSAPRPTPRG